MTASKIHLGSRRLLERDSALAALGRAFDAAADGQGRLVLIAGEAGVGKTALVRQLAADHREGQVLVGASEPLETPEALAPLFEMASGLGPEVQAHLAAERPRTELFAAVLAALEHGGHPRLVVFEDVHWADQATLELLRYVGRRVDRLPALIVATFRSEEATAGTPLSVVLGDLATSPAVQRLSLEPLSKAATAVLAAGSGADARQLFEHTSGNPFFITEVLAVGGEGVPTTVRDAVLARVSRLPPPTRLALQAAAALGRRFEAELLAAVLDVLEVPRWTMRDAVFTGMLQWDGSALGFRHALAQTAITQSLSAESLQRLHAAIFTELERTTSGPDGYAALVLHAEAAGDTAAVVRYAPLAAARAAALSAHRESAALYAKALAGARRESTRRRAELAERHADQLYHSADLGRAAAGFRIAAELWRTAGDDLGLGRALTRVAAISFLLGQYVEATAAETEAFETLERLPPCRELVMTYENRSRRLFMEQDPRGAEHWGLLARGVADRLEDAEAVLNTRVCVGAARLLAADEAARLELIECHRLASERNLPELAARIALYLGWLPILFHSYLEVERYLDEGIAFAIDHELEYWRLLVTGARVRYCLDQGRWREAEELAPTVLDHPDPVSLAKITVLIALGRLRARRGEADAAWYLDEAAAMARAHGRLEPVSGSVPARVEALWLAGEADEARRAAEAGLESGAAALGNPWWVGELVILLRRVGANTATIQHEVAEPYALELRGEYRSAAEWWQARGCRYQAALALGSADEPGAVAQAVSMLDELGAVAAAAWARRQLRALGVSSVPRGPRPSTSANPAGLTRREQDVLDLVADGLTNVEIGERLFLSPRTVEHHLAAVMRKLNVASRNDAVAAANRLAKRQSRGGSIPI
jgi:DNA-binding CsgD family transcriptional regulator